MGRYFIELDPDGYNRVDEPGVCIVWPGRTLFEKLVAPEAGAAAVPLHNFACMDGSEWLLARPRQFSPAWHLDARLSEHVLTNSLWTWGAGVTVDEFEMTRLPSSSSNPDNLFLGIVTPPSLTALDAINYTALGVQAGVDLSAFKTIGFTNSTPVGVTLSPEPHDWSPFLQVGHFPEPHDVVVMGWGKMALVMTRDVVALVRTPNHDGVTWELLGKWSRAGRSTDYRNNWWLQFSKAGIFQALDPHLVTQAVCVVPVGDKEIHLFFGTGDPAVVVLPQSVVDTDLRFGHGPWWLAAKPNQKVLIQTQILGYEQGSTAAINNPCRILFDLGSYKPTLAPEFWPLVVLHGSPGSVTAAIDGSGLFTATSSETDEALQFQILDGAGAPWVSDGTKSKGGFKIEIIPSTAPGVDGAYTCPQFGILEQRFPIKLVPRENDPLTLDDGQFKFISAYASLHDPKAKKIEVALTETGLAAYRASNLSRRGNYPIHVSEDTSTPADGVPDTVRIRGWVKEHELTVLALKADTVATQILGTGIRAEGLMGRMDDPFLYLPQICNPLTPGVTLHGFAVETSLAQSGFDVTDPDVVYLHTDTAPLDIQAIPGTWAITPGTFGVRNSNESGGPKWGETRLAYAERIAKRLRGWVLYERLDGKIMYHPDLFWDIQAGYEYFKSWVIYRNRADALAASASAYQRQAVAGVLSIEEPTANFLQVNVAHPDDIQMATKYISKERRAVEDPDDVIISVESGAPAI
jgi:hypothetical protein